MGSIEDHYLDIERQKKFTEIETRMIAYNHDVDTVKSLTPKIQKHILANPPERYRWIIIDGKPYVSWSMLDESDQERSATQTIDMLQDGRLVSVRLVGDKWMAIAPVELGHISFTDEAAQSAYIGGCGYQNGDRNGEKPLGSSTVSRLAWQMQQIAAGLGVDTQERATQTPPPRARKGLFGFLFPQ